MFEVQNGFPFESKYFNTSREGMPLLRIRDVVPGSTETFYSGPFDEQFLVQPGDVVVGMDGDFNVRVWRGPTALLNQRVCRLIPRGGYSPRLLPLVLQGYLDAINARTSSITVKHLSSRTIGEIPLPVPPIGEQARLLESIESYVSRLDAAVDSLKRVQTKLKAYRASVLKAAVEGRLVPTEAAIARQEKRDYEPAQVLLDRILNERRRRWEENEIARLVRAGKAPKSDNWKSKYHPPEGPDTSQLPSLPEGWCWATAEQVSTRITDGEHITPPRTDTGVYLLSARNVGDGRLVLDEVDYISEDTHEALCKRLLVQPGDVLLSCSGSVGRTCVVPPGTRFSLVRSVAVIKPSVVRSDFMSFALASPLLQSQIHRRKSQTAQANIFQGSIKKLAFPLPPLAEQDRIIDALDVHLDVAGRQREDTRHARFHIARLKQSILKWAFKGQLVEQDPNDEPAESLLARIQAGRASATPKTKPKARKEKAA